MRSEYSGPIWELPMVGRTATNGKKVTLNKACALIGAVGGLASFVMLLCGEGLLSDHSGKALSPVLPHQPLQIDSSSHVNIAIEAAPAVKPALPPSTRAPEFSQVANDPPPIEFAEKEESVSSEGSNALTVHRRGAPTMVAGQHVIRHKGESMILSLKPVFTSTFVINSGCAQLYLKQKPYHRAGQKEIACESDDQPIRIYTRNRNSFSVVAIEDLDMVLERVDAGDHTSKL